MDNYCRNCGTKLNKNDNFCPNCGQRIKSNKIGDIKIFINKYKKQILIVCSLILLLIIGVYFISKKSKLYIMPNHFKSEVDTIVKIETSEDPLAFYVYITENGSTFHKDKNCSNMEKPSKVTIDYAVSLGYKACKKCFK